MSAVESASRCQLESFCISDFSVIFFAWIILSGRAFAASVLETIHTSFTFVNLMKRIVPDFYPSGRLADLDECLRIECRIYVLKRESAPA
jgi:hypothetical protein